MEPVRDPAAGLPRDFTLMERTRSEVLSDRAWSVDPLGHSEFQIRHFIVKADNPTTDSQYKQVIRELWTRWEAWRGELYELRKTEALLERERARWCFFQWQRMFRDNEVEMLESRRDSIRLKLEHVLLRESRILMTILGELSPKEGDRNEVELDNWARRAVTNPQVRTVLTDQHLLGSRRIKEPIT